MNRLLAFIRPRLLLAEGLLLYPTTLALRWLARRACAWEQSWKARVRHVGLADAVDRLAQTRSPKP